MSENIQRRLAAILYADVAGYSRLTGEDEVGTHQQLSAGLDLISERIKSAGGRVVHYAGDAVLADFGSVVAAINAAVGIQHALAEQTANVPDDHRLQFRIGVNLGEVIVDRDEIYGDGVNVAARLESLAEPGGICVSGTVFEQVKGKLDVGFQDMGLQKVKNISEPIRVYRIALERSAAGMAPGGEMDLALPTKPSIAVLPFANHSGDPEQEYFSDGVADDLITALSNVRSFFVIDRSSSFTFKGKTVTVKEVGQALGVHYVVEGSVRKAGDKVRVSAQLVEAATGTHVWADRYDGALDNIFDLQDRIAASVVGAIEPQLHRAEIERIRHKRPESFDAYDLTLAGLAYMNRLNQNDTDKALALFRRAIEADPTYARAYACASWCYRRQVQLQGMVLSDNERAEAVRLAQAALKADRTDPYVLWQAGVTAALVEGDFEEGAALIDRSLAINANANRAWLSSAMRRCYSGDPETAIEHAEKAMRLSPLDVSMWVAYGCLATAHMQLENYETAAEWARKSVRMHRDNLPAHLVLAASLALLGRESEAKASVRELLALDPGFTIASLKKRFPIGRYRNLEGFLDGLRTAGLPA